MAKKITKTTVCIEETFSREVLPVEGKIHRRMRNAIIERKVFINNRPVYSELYPIENMQKFAQPQLQAFIETLAEYKVEANPKMGLSISFYKGLSIFLACIWLITFLLSQIERI